MVYVGMLLRTLFATIKVYTLNKKKSIYHYVHYVSGIILRALQILTHLSLITTLWDSFYNYPHFRDEETEV